MNLGENMIRISDKEFTLLTEYLRNNYGINLSKKRTLIEGRLNNYLIQKGFTDYGSYIDFVFKDHTGNEMSNVINYLTTNYSYFMREWDHFNFYKNKILPEAKAKIRDNDLRIWSAGCSTGEEPYTIAMLNDEFFEKQKTMWDTKVLATDISLKALGKAEKGIYDDEALEKVPMSWKLLYFDKMSDDRWEVKSSLKKEVIFRRFNLIEDVFPFRKKFHVIFCRNVMIYFESKTKKELIDRFYDVTEPGGYLIIGHSESIDRNETRYSYVMPSIYKRIG
jgi:chemotaxis protein methyltransferase CheR